MLEKWNPFATSGLTRPAPQLPVYDELFKHADRLFDAALWSGHTTFPADLYETDDALVMQVDLPGHDPKKIDVVVEGEVLTLRAARTSEAKGTFLRRERSMGQVARSFVLPRSADPSRCDATFEQGVLTLTLPKREEAKPRCVTVKVK